MILFSAKAVLKVIYPIPLLESGPVHEIQMIDLTSLEWFLLLSIVILVTWFLILFQARSSGANELGLESHAIHEDLVENQDTNYQADQSKSNVVE